MTFEVERERHGRRPFTVVELDLDYCGLTYGVAPCSASIGASGTAKCFNTRATCQDSANFSRSTKTYRFCSNVADVPRDLDAMPLLEAVDITPVRLKFGAGLGERGSCTIRLRDGRHSDRGIDKYVAERSYNPLKQGTMLGRLVARNPYFLGRTVRVKHGYLTRNAAGASVYDESNFRTRTYFIETMTSPSLAGVMTITAKDILKLADDERAKAPRPAKGRLLADITSSATSASLTPTGVGDLYYSASGKLRINGEIMAFTRTGDTLTLSGRGSNSTTAAAHSADDAVQECLDIVSMNAHAIIRKLYVEYAEMPAEYIPLADWLAEDTKYNARFYTAIISEPTGVNKLVAEICEQAPANVAWDELGAQVLYRAVRPANALRQLTDAESFVAGSIRITPRLDLRISQCIVYFGQRNPTEPVDKRSNYAAAIVWVGEGEQVAKYGQPRVKEIFGRWLPVEARTFAEDLAKLMINRYDEAPVQLDVTLEPKDALGIADLFQATTRALPSADGTNGTATFQVMSVEQDFAGDKLQVSALQERFSASAGVRTLSVSVDRFNYNLRAAHDLLYGAPSGPVTVECTIEAGVTIGSQMHFDRGTYLGAQQWTIPDGGDPTAAAFSVGEWPAGSQITVIQKGNVQGIGGVGGHPTSHTGHPARDHDSGRVGIDYGGARNSFNGIRGGCALYARFPVTWQYEGRLWGGGGGGLHKHDEASAIQAKGSGGGGAGVTGGLAMSNGFGTEPQQGTDTVGGLGGTYQGKTGGTGGDPGQAGHTPDSYATGEPVNTGKSVAYAGLGGPAINGASFVTLVNGGGSILGDLIN